MIQLEKLRGPIKLSFSHNLYFHFRMIIKKLQQFFLEDITNFGEAPRFPS